jgi:hypothetical protein
MIIGVLEVHGLAEIGKTSKCYTVLIGAIVYQAKSNTVTI